MRGRAALAGLLAVLALQALPTGPAEALPPEVTVASTVSTAPAALAAAPPVRSRRPPAFPVRGCAVSYVAAHHDYPATDVFAARGCAFVAPTAGVVDEVGRRDRWRPETNRGADRGGLFVSVVGRDGVRVYGSHLSSVAPGIVPGASVRRGQLLGRVGESGSARGTGSHLHLGLSWPTPPGAWWIRRGTVAPAPYLDAWRRGRDLRPTAAVARARARYGDDSRCRSYC